MEMTSSFKKKISKASCVLLFILPALIPLSVFWLWPMVKAIFMSFTDWDYMSSTYNMVGTENYRELFSDNMFYDALKNTFVFTLGTLIPTIAGGLAIAMVLKKSIKGSALYKAIIFSPWITPTVAISIVWSWIFEPQYGFANYVLQLFNLPKSQWLQSSDTAMIAVIIVTVWKGFGWAMVFYLTALERVPKELYEAAAIDGANSWNKFISITLPLISPTTFFLSIITTINSIQAYDQIQVLTQGGPAGSTRTILYMYYQTAFENFNMDFEQYKSDIAEIQQQEKPKREYKDPVDGKYTCDIVSLELSTNKAGDKLMLKGSFKITDGEFMNSRLWVNKVLTGTRNDSFAVKNAIDFLNSLGAVQEVEFTGDFDDLATQIDIVFADVKNCVFEVVQKTTDSGFKNLYINDVFEN